MTPLEAMRAAAARTIGSVSVPFSTKSGGVFAPAVPVLCAVVSDDHEPGYSETSRTQYVRRRLVLTCLETPMTFRTGDRVTYDGLDFTVQAITRNVLGLPQVTATHTKRTGFSGTDAMIPEGEA